VTRSSRRAFSLVELMVAVGIGTLLLIVAYNLIVLMTRSERAVDRDAMRAITESTMMQSLMMDVRSAHTIEPAGADTYRIVRWVVPEGGGAFVESVVTWQAFVREEKVTRTVQGQSPKEFSFAGLTDPRGLGFTFRVEKEPDARFTP
jgi:prepilin-type N-terminal cleavage/methylation domain-containing protein